MLGAVDLSGPELRVLGSLVEKQLTTPQQYPLTLNALTLASNQTSNRDPVVHYEERTAEEAITRIKSRGLAAFVHPSHGRSALRFRHTLDEALGLGARPLALLAVLMLRGPQTPGELRVRTERMVGFGDLPEVVAELEALANRDEPLVVRLDRVPGQKEDRYAHLLGAQPAEATHPTSTHPSHAPDPGTRATETRSADTQLGSGEMPPRLATEVAALRAEVASLRRDLDELRSQLGA